VSKRPSPPRPFSPQAFNASEAPTLKQDIPDEIADSEPPAYQTTKVRKVELEALVTEERRKSGMVAAYNAEEAERFERRERRETVPAPPDAIENHGDRARGPIPTMPDTDPDLVDD